MGSPLLASRGQCRCVEDQEFDAQSFGISWTDATATDPQQQGCLENTDLALEDAE